jgi:CBS domain-containing protein
MLTVTDLIDIILHFANLLSPEVEFSGLISDYSIRSWMEISARERPERLISVDVEEPLFNVIRRISANRIHRAPVFHKESEALLFIITNGRLLDMIVRNVDFSTIELFDRAVGEFGIGTMHESLIVVSTSAPVIEILKLFQQNSISTIPIIDEGGTVVEVFSRSDALHLNLSGPKGLAATVGEVLGEHRHGERHPIQACTMNDSLGSVVIRMTQHSIQSVVIVDAGKSPIGLISITDVFNFFVSAIGDRGENEMISDDQIVDVPFDPNMEEEGMDALVDGRRSDVGIMVTEEGSGESDLVSQDEMFDIEMDG